MRKDRGPYPEQLGRLSTRLLVRAAENLDAQAAHDVHPGATAIYALLDYAVQLQTKLEQTVLANEFFLGEIKLRNLVSSEQALSLETAPKNGKMLLLLVDYSAEDAHHPLEDKQRCWTIGFNSLEDTGIDEWQFAGWDWSQDCFCQGTGEVVGWQQFSVPWSGE